MVSAKVINARYFVRVYFQSLVNSIILFHSSKIYSFQIIALVAASTVLIGYTIAMPQGGLCPNGQPWYPDANTVDANVSRRSLHCFFDNYIETILYYTIISLHAIQGCTVGFCAKVCPTGAITNDGRSVTFRGNRGPAVTYSNNELQHRNSF